MRIVPIALLATLGCSSTEEPRLIAELPEGVALSEVAGIEMSLARGRCGSEETVWSAAFRPSEPTAAPPRLEEGSYSVTARALSEDCAVVAEGCTALDLPLDAGELVVRTTSAPTPEPGCAPWLCSDGLCSREACALSADVDTEALFPMDQVSSGALTDVVAGIESSFDPPPSGVAGPEGCGMAVEGNATSVAVVPGGSPLTLAAGAIDLFAWFPADLPLAGTVALLWRETDPPGVLSPFGLLWLPDGRLAVRSGLRSDGIPKVAVCSTTPVPTERWVHIGINLGPPGVEFWLDGVLQAGEGRYDDDAGQPGVCVSTAEPDPLPVGDEPWFIMGRPRMSGDEQTGYDAFYGRIDQLRFSRRRRAFSGFVGVLP